MLSIIVYYKVRITVIMSMISCFRKNLINILVSEFLDSTLSLSTACCLDSFLEKKFSYKELLYQPFSLEGFGTGLHSRCYLGTWIIFSWRQFNWNINIRGTWRHEINFCLFFKEFKLGALPIKKSYYQKITFKKLSICEGDI